MYDTCFLRQEYLATTRKSHHSQIHAAFNTAFPPRPPIILCYHDETTALHILF